MTFTTNELDILQSIYESMKSNGFDFGIVEDIIPGTKMANKLTARGVLREVRKKLKLEFCSYKENGCTQFSFPGTEIAYSTTFADWLKLVSKEKTS